MVASCKAEASTRQRVTSGLHLLPLSHLLFAECLAERYQVPDLISLVRPGLGFEPTTLRTGGEHSTTRPLLLDTVTSFKKYFSLNFTEKKTNSKVYHRVIFIGHNYFFA